MSSAEVKKPSPTRSEQPGLTCSVAGGRQKVNLALIVRFAGSSFQGFTHAAQVYCAGLLGMYSMVPLLPVSIQSNGPLVHHLLAMTIATS